jgi:serine/threonine protein kinase
MAAPLQLMERPGAYGARRSAWSPSVDAARESAALATADLVSGLWFGDWVLVAPLGRGAQSVVWEARPRDGGEPVALKLLSGRLLWNASWRQRFAREAQLGARLRHPNLVLVLGAGEARGRPWLAQELVPGGRTLADAIAGARRTAEPDGAPQRALPREHFHDVAALFAQVADALAAVHAAGVLHRDVKPGNILVTPDGGAKLADFGCASADPDDGARDGTPAYASPEHVRGAPLDARSDLFALGATLHEALVLRRAFDGRSAAQVRAAVLACRPADPCALRPEVPRALAAIAARCMQAEPELRYAAAGDVAQALCRFLEAPTTSVAPAGWARVSRWLLPRSAG